MCGFFKPNIEKMWKNRDVKGLIKALKHKDEKVRYMAGGVLGDIGDVKAVEPLINALKDENSDVRWLAARSLSQIEADVEIKRRGYGIRPL